MGGPGDYIPGGGGGHSMLWIQGRKGHAAPQNICMPNSDCNSVRKSIHCRVCDLRSYAFTMIL